MKPANQPAPTRSGLSLTDLYLQAQEEEAGSDEDTQEVNHNRSEDTKSSTAVACGLLAAGTVAAVAATTTVKTSSNGISSHTNLGPFSGASSASVSDHTLSTSTNQRVDLGQAHASSSDGCMIGKKGLGEHHSESWNIGGRSGLGESQSHTSLWSKKGLETTDSSSINLFGHTASGSATTKIGDGNVLSYEEKGNFFGKNYKFGFKIPEPDLKPVGDALKPVGRFFKHSGKDVAKGAVAIGEAVVKHGPDVLEGAVKGAEVVFSILGKLG